MISYTYLAPLGGIAEWISIGLVFVLAAVTLWRLFRKANQPGWAALMPFYNTYILLKIAQKPGWWLVLYFVPVVNVVTHIIVSRDVAKKFGKRTLFGIALLWFLPFIGYPVLAFGNAAYQKKGRPSKQRSMAMWCRSLLIVVVCVLAIVCTTVAALGAYYRYENHKIRDEVTAETTKYQNVSFDTLDEWNNDYRMTVMYPKTEDAQINAAARAKLDTYVNDFRVQVAKKTKKSQPYYLHIVGSVNLASSKVINFLYVGNWTINGKSGDLRVNALFDRSTGKEVQASQLFKGNGYLRIGSDAARKALPGILKSNYSKTLAEKGTAPEAANFDQYEIVDEKTIDIIFEPGQVADSSLGTVKVPLSLDSLSDEWNQDEVDKLFPDFIAALQAKEAAAAAAAKKAAEEQAAAQATAQAAKQSHQVGNYLPAHGNVDCTKAKCIALTFDDGPGLGTDTILDTLEKYQVPATFMVIGKQVASHTAELKREAADGNDIGSHTWDHADLTTLSVASIQNEVNQTQSAVMNVLGKQPFMLRPPYGAYNQTVLNTVSMPLILWSVDPNDWKDRDADIVYQRVMSHVKPGAIVLSHDIYPTTATAYTRIIPDLIAQGYTLVTVSNLEGINPANLPLQVFTGVY